ncbi:hypothetical protein CO669_25240 [Bradyrhizobium sp. Y36]|uniref:hypothetical protein n=1 Tax=Bradyrhizobium sp. Y36 TaxID=2035447 RepID=UPI000BEBF2CE|nr:hypothetical protein [Bradyrhizobium sp. Y36]PDT87474.1 hypothetical protein CO669_25240 [Bradyrhizobium sp. Y36]
MLDKEPLWFPSRNRFAYNPAIPDRQLWAIGMVATQWSMTEWLLEAEIRKLAGANSELIEKHKALRSLRERLDFFENRIQETSQEPLRSRASSFVGRIRNLSSKRNEILHRMWGGGMPSGDSWNNPEDYPETDAALLRQHRDKYKAKSDDASATIHWRLTFSETRKIAVEISALNRDFIMLFMSDQS